MTIRDHATPTQRAAAWLAAVAALAVAPAALRHRVAPSFEAEADGLDADRIVAGILSRLAREVPEDAPSAEAAP